MSGHAKHDQECGQDYSCPDKSGRARPAGARNRQVSLIKARSWSDQSVWGLAGQARPSKSDGQVTPSQLRASLAKPGSPKNDILELLLAYSTGAGIS